MAYIGVGLSNLQTIDKLDNITLSSATTYNLTKNSVAFTPISKDNIICSINGVVQYGNFTVSGSQITFTGASLSSDDVMDFILHIGEGVFLVPNDGSVTKVKTDFISDATAGITIKGDGSSNDGYIQLNCSQNSHGVKIKSPPHSAGQSYTLTLPQSITNGYFLQTDGSGNLSFAQAVETKPTITSSTFYITPDINQTFNISGTNFVEFPIVEFVSSTGAITRASAVSYTNATTLSVTTNLSSGAYRVRVENPNGTSGISSTAICNASTSPTWSTGTDLGSFAGNFSGTLVTLSASSDSSITYSEVGSNLTTGNMTLSGANITTTDFGGSSTTPTQYTFTIRATDGEGQYLDRTFTINSSFGITEGVQLN